MSKEDLNKLKDALNKTSGPSERRIRELVYLQEKILEEISDLKYGDPERPPSLGERIADVVVGYLGSWRFIVLQSTLLGIWIAANTYWLTIANQWDPYPFILLNLTLSFQAAFTAPLILMAQNRSNQEDRRRAVEAYHSIDHIEQMFKMLLQQAKLINGTQNEQEEVNEEDSEAEE